MKVRTGFVTNSSSTSFGAATTQAILGIFSAAALMGLKCTAAPELEGEYEQTEPVIGDSGLDADELERILSEGETLLSHMQRSSAADISDVVVDAQLDKLEQVSVKIGHEIEKYLQQWEKAKISADPEDPGFSALEQQYRDYIDYLNNERLKVEVSKFELETARAEELMQRQYREVWIKQRQDDLIQVKEQKTLLEAVARGYGRHADYDISGVTERLSQLAAREKELEHVLRQNNASVNYTAARRDEIGPDPDIIKSNEEYRRQIEENEKRYAEEKKEHTRVRREFIEQAQKYHEMVKQQELKKAAFWNVLTKTAELAQFVSDTSIDILSKVTGPKGKAIKRAYTITKEIGGGFGEGLAGGDMAANLAKGVVKGVSDVVEDLVEDTYGKKAKHLYTVLSGGGRGAFEAMVEGKSFSEITASAVEGTFKGTLDVMVSSAFDNLLPELPDIPSGIDLSEMSFGDFYSSLKTQGVDVLKTKGGYFVDSAGNVRDFAGEYIGNQFAHYTQTAVLDGAKSALEDQVANFIKGEDIIFDDLKFEYSEDILKKSSQAVAGFIVG